MSPIPHIPHQGAQQVNVLHFQSNHMHVFQPAIQPAKRTSLFQSTSLVTSIIMHAYSSLVMIYMNCTSWPVILDIFQPAKPDSDLSIVFFNQQVRISHQFFVFLMHVFPHPHACIPTSHKHTFLVYVFPPVTSIHSSCMYFLPVTMHTFLMYVSH